MRGLAAFSAKPETDLVAGPHHACEADIVRNMLLSTVRSRAKEQLSLCSPLEAVNYTADSGLLPIAAHSLFFLEINN